MDKKKTAAIVVACIFVVLLIVVLLLLNRKYTVTFDSKGGTAVESQIVKRNNSAVEPEKPSKEGFVFLGWYTEEDEKFDFNTKIKKNLTLIAKWGAGSGSTTRLKLEADKREISVDDEVLLTLKLDGKPVDSSKVKWTSSNEDIATVDQNGRVKAQKAGRVTITAEYDGQKVEYTLVIADKKEDNTNTNTNTNTATNTTPGGNTATGGNTTTGENTTTGNENTTTGGEPEEPTITYTYEWVKIEESSAEEYMLYIVSSEGNRVSGTVTITTLSGKIYTDTIPATGKMFIKSAVTSVSNVQAN